MVVVLTYFCNLDRLIFLQFFSIIFFNYLYIFNGCRWLDTVFDYFMQFFVTNPFFNEMPISVGTWKYECPIKAIYLVTSINNTYIRADVKINSHILSKMRILVHVSLYGKMRCPGFGLLFSLHLYRKNFNHVVFSYLSWRNIYGVFFILKHCSFS